jgi:hypothetical protein
MVVGLRKRIALRTLRLVGVVKCFGPTVFTNSGSST